jgi:hypothetical protein
MAVRMLLQPLELKPALVELAVPLLERAARRLMFTLRSAGSLVRRSPPLAPLRRRNSPIQGDHVGNHQAR